MKVTQLDQPVATLEMMMRMIFRLDVRDTGEVSLVD
jgi:hypothetical protein